jgi:hypothetical protein
MSKPDKDDLLHIDEHHWVRHELPIWIRILGLTTLLTVIAGAIYLIF